MAAYLVLRYLLLFLACFSLLQPWSYFKNIDNNSIFRYQGPHNGLYPFCALYNQITVRASSRKFGFTRFTYPQLKATKRGITCLKLPGREPDFNLTIHMDVEPNPGPNNNPPDNNKMTLCGDLPSGLNVNHWNLNSIASHQSNTKLDQLRFLPINPGKETHIQYLV